MVIDQSAVPDQPPPTGGNVSNYDEEVDFYETVLKILKPENEEPSYVSQQVPSSEPGLQRRSTITVV